MALAEKKDADKEEQVAKDPVVGILERIARSAAGVTQAVGEYSLDLGLAANQESETPLSELSRHLQTVSLLSQGDTGTVKAGGLVFGTAVET